MKTHALIGTFATGLIALGSVQSAQAAVVITNGGFEDNGTVTGNANLFLPLGWDVENTFLGGIQNSTNDAVGSGVNEGVTAAQATGDQYLRLVSDTGSGGQYGGIHQAVGSLADGESVTITGDYFSGQGANYSVIVELYDDDPLGLGSVLATATLADGVLSGNSSSTFSLSFTASGGNGSSLFLRLRAPELVTNRGGVDNLQVVPEPGSLALMGLGGLCVLRRRRGN